MEVWTKYTGARGALVASNGRAKRPPPRRRQIGASLWPGTGIAQIRRNRAAWPQWCAWKRGETALRVS